MLRKTMASLMLLLLVLACAPLTASAQDKVLELKNQIIELQNKGPLTINDFQFCRNIMNYGTYIPYQAAEFPVGSTIKVYYEPALWFTNVANGNYEFWLTQDLRLEDASGQVLFEKQKLVDLHFNTVKPVLDVYMTNEFGLGKLPPGEYVYTITLHDEITGQQAETRRSFTIVPQ